MRYKNEFCFQSPPPGGLYFCEKDVEEKVVLKTKHTIFVKIISGKKQKWPNTIKNYLAEPPVSCYNIPIDAASRAGPLLAAYHVRRIF